jgi:hypothetical protein
MKRIAGWWLAGTLAISGCTVVSGPGGRLPDDQGFDPLVVRTPQPTLPNVFVVKGQLVVDQEPIRLWLSDYDKEKRTVNIAWALAANSDAQWPKPEEAIVFSPPAEKHSCEVRGAGRKVVVCTLQYKKLATYKYTLKVISKSGNPLALDPNIVNME